MSRAIDRSPSPGEHVVQRFAVPALLVLLSVFFAAFVAEHHTGIMSPVDEWVYLDYLDKLAGGHIPVQGEPIGPVALARMACNGVFPYGAMGPGCDGDYTNLSAFPFGGITSADAYSPLFFILTLALGKVLAVLPVDQLTAWRLTGSLWLAATSCVLHVLLRSWKVSRLASLAIILAFIASPFSWWTYTYVSTDAPSVLMGAALLLAATRHVRGKGGSWWIPVLSVIAVLLKVTNILAVCLVALYLLVVWWRDRREYARQGRPATSGLVLPLVTLGAAGVAEVLWLVIHRLMAVGTPANQGISIPLTLEELGWQVYNPLSALMANHFIAGTPSTPALNIPGGVDRPLVWLCVAGVIGAFWTIARHREEAPLVDAVALAAVTFGPMLAVVLSVATGSYFPLPSRYGAPIVAGFLLMVGLVMKDRRAAPILLGYGVLLLVVTLSHTTTIALD